MRQHGLWGLILLLSVGVFVGMLVTGQSLRPDPVYAFVETQPGHPSEPVTWDACDAIVYHLETGQAPGTTSATVDFVAEAVDHVSDLTGLRFRHEPDLEQPADVLIAWSDAEHVDDLAGDVAGLGGATSKAFGDHRWYVVGQILLDTAAFTRASYDDEDRAVLLHELGHLVGLDHVDSFRELMHPTPRRTDFGEGDLEGLALLGTSRRTCSR